MSIHQGFIKPTRYTKTLKHKFGELQSGRAAEPPREIPFVFDRMTNPLEEVD